MFLFILFQDSLALAKICFRGGEVSSVHHCPKGTNWALGLDQDKRNSSVLRLPCELNMNERTVIEPPTLNCEFSWVPYERAPTKAGDGSQSVSFDAYE